MIIREGWRRSLLQQPELLFPSAQEGSEAQRKDWAGGQRIALGTEVLEGTSESRERQWDGGAQDESRACWIESLGPGLYRELVQR